MVKRSKGASSSSQFASKSAELAVAAPQVVAHRLVRMAIAGAMPNKRDRDEFSLMHAEKYAAFNESWAAMGAQAWLSQQTLAAAVWKSMLSPLFMGHGVSSFNQQVRSATADILSKGIEPVHKRAIANAKRLART
jgi:hypothetical protein